MSSSINTNLPSFTAQRHLGVAQRSLATSMQRLSSGLRINSAFDDAAGLAISERIGTQIRGGGVAARNANDGISLAQVAEGALASSAGILQRIREMAVQSINDTNSASDRAALQSEVSQLTAELNRIANSTEFNGMKLLDGSAGTMQFQVGANAHQTITLDIGNFQTNKYGDLQTDTVTTVDMVTTTINPVPTNAALWAQSAAQAAAADPTLSDGEREAWSRTADAWGSIGADAAEKWDDGSTNGAFSSWNSHAHNETTSRSCIWAGLAWRYTVANDMNQGLWENFWKGAAQNWAAGGLQQLSLSQLSSLAAGMTDTGHPALPNLSAAERARAASVAACNSYAALPFSSFKTTTVTTPVSHSVTILELFSVSSIDISTSLGATKALLTCDSALDTISGQRARLGAFQSRMESTISNLQTSTENLSAARSRIQDADFAVETANLSRTQILQQASTAIVAQANQLPQGVLALLRQ